MEELEKKTWGVSVQDYIHHRKPSQFYTRDSFAVQQGLRTPPHINVEGFAFSYSATFNSFFEGIKLFKRLLRQIEIKSSIKDTLGDSEKALELLESVLRRFHKMARQIRIRHGGETRPTLEIRDEYDVQDLLHGVLKLFFDDVRAEDVSPQYAGGTSRMDFILKPEKIVIEVKKTRESLTDKKVGEEILIDAGRYSTHPDCKILIPFIYDPEERIINPVGLEMDLDKISREGLIVKTIICQK